MMRLTPAVLFLAVVSGSGNAQTSRTGQIPATSFFEVSASKEATAEYWLKDKQVLPQSQKDIEFFGQRNFQCPAGETPYLIRATYENGGTGTFQLEYSGSTILVAHRSLGSASGIHNTALVVCLGFQPTEVVSRVSGAK